MEETVRTLLRQALNDPASDFRAGQWEAIDALVNQSARLLVVQRTGWGKSLVYFLTTRLLRDRGTGPTLLISPLLALMRNQILAARRLGIHAATINSSNREEWSQVRSALESDSIDLLIISPERLSDDTFRNNMLIPVADRIGMFVVDEAHCISDWGHDFRPDYRRIVSVLRALPANIPVLATTATANDRVIADIYHQLGNQLQLVRGPLARDSLRLQTIHLPSQAARMAWLAEHLPTLPGSGIVYTLTTRDAQRVADWLQSQRINAHAYYADVENNRRQELEDLLLANQVKALVATTALGMGFDKPDLGFVIHFQRPGSVVHYYQQVGRAGRAVEEAYGILLSGDEDQEITDYFIATAFPPIGHTEEVLRVLRAAQHGLSIPQLQQHVNLARSQIEKVLKILVTEPQAPVMKEGSEWQATPVSYAPSQETIAHLTRIRRDEQTQMLTYLQSQECLMAFLRKALDDPDTAPCGRCSVCLGAPVVSHSYQSGLAQSAIEFLRRSDLTIEPRRQWEGDALACYGWRGRIAEHLRAEQGRALCTWGDAGWGELVKRGKQQDGRFDDALVEGSTALLQRWQPAPTPAWITCIPSSSHPNLVPDFARRLAQRLQMRFVPCISKIQASLPQKGMHNSYQQAHNLAGVFAVNAQQVLDAPVLLVDDMVDSRWTFTVLAALLRTAGSGKVFPFALASTASS